ncbi:hypothetical protein LUZ60_014907 [Juncus effusus]|nr:hypothetical protein LUZ60_014907 [Juncus effusus]
MYFNNIIPNLYMYSSILLGLCKKGMMIEARWYLENLDSKLGLRDIILYNTVINGYIKLKDLYNVVSLYEQAVNLGLEPTIITINSLIHGFCKVGKLGFAERIFNETLIRNKLRPTIVTYTILMDAYSKTRNVNKMINFYNHMLKNSIRPNQITISVLIKGLCKQKRFLEAQEFVNQMQREGMKLDEITYNTLIQGFCKGQNWNLAFQTHDNMLKNGLIPTHVTYNVLINGLCLHGKIDMAEMLLDSLIDKNVNLGKFAYMTLIKAFCAKERPQKALNLFERMLNSGFEGELKDFSSVINRMCKRGFVYEAVLVLKLMLGFRVYPDQEIFRVLCKGLEREMDWLGLKCFEALILKTGAFLIDGD